MSASPQRCATCGSDPAKRNDTFSECSHVECPHRRVCWSGGTGDAPWIPSVERDPLAPLFDRADE